MFKKNIIYGPYPGEFAPSSRLFRPRWLRGADRDHLVDALFVCGVSYHFQSPTADTQAERELVEYIESYVAWRTANQLLTSGTPLGVPRNTASPTKSVVDGFLQAAADPIFFPNPDSLKLIKMKMREQQCRPYRDARTILLSEAQWLAEDVYKGTRDRTLQAQELARCVQATVS